MKELKGSKTEANLMAAFAGESQASIKYQYYASQAKKDGYVQISNIFAETAGNESEHAKLWFKYLHDGAVPGTLDILRDAGLDMEKPQAVESCMRSFEEALAALTRLMEA